MGNYPAKGVGLHYHIAKLFLCSHALRTVSTAPPVSAATIAGINEYTALAISSAKSILQGIVVEEEIQSYLNGLPTYFDTMIAFAVVFLLKLVSRDGSVPHVDRNGILDILNQVSTTLTNITAAMRPQHLLSGISSSIKKLIAKAGQADVYEPSTVPYGPVDPPLSQARSDNNETWMLSPNDAMFLRNFDFTGTSQDLDFNFMDFPPYSQDG